MDYRRQCQSEAIFGSSSRRDSDRLSDRDYLIIDSRSDVRRKRRFELEQMGWSVASYSWTRLASLARRKALFVQHLKLEALMVKDEAGRLRDVLDCYSPKTDYGVEINQTGAVMVSVIDGNTELNLSNWMFDVIAVNVRNLAILALANKGEYVFSYNDAIRRLAAIYDLPAYDVCQLLKLREIKAKYRNGWYYSASPKWEVDQLLGSAQRCVERLRCSFVGIIGTRDFLAHAGVKDLYFRSRLIERDALRSVPTIGSDLEECEYLSREILRKTKRPRDYLWQFEHDVDTIQEVASLRKIAEPSDLLHCLVQSPDYKLQRHGMRWPCLIGGLGGSGKVYSG